MKPTYDELEEIAAIATALTISTRARDSAAMKADYTALAGALHRLHDRYRDVEWTASIIDALARLDAREDCPFPL